MILALLYKLNNWWDILLNLSNKAFFAFFYENLCCLEFLNNHYLHWLFYYPLSHWCVTSCGWMAGFSCVEIPSFQIPHPIIYLIRLWWTYRLLAFRDDLQLFIYRLLRELYKDLLGINLGVNGVSNIYLKVLI